MPFFHKAQKWHEGRYGKLYEGLVYVQIPILQDVALETKFSIIFPTVPLFNKVRDSKGRFRTPNDEKKKNYL